MQARACQCTAHAHEMATSCENKRTKAYSDDLRWRMVYLTKALGKSYREAAADLRVDASTVCKTVAIFDDTGDVRPKDYPPNTGTAKLTEVDKLIILELAIERPGIYLREIQAELSQETGTEVDVSTICRFLHASGFTRQKLQVTAKQRSDELRAEYLSDMQVYRGHPEMLVFVDETGADRRDCMRKFGYSLRGKPARAHKLLWRGQRVNALTAMSTAGILDCYTTTGSVTADTFEEFVTESLSPLLQPFDGINPNSVIILDNASIHHVGRVVQAIQNTGAIVQFVPPYSPDLNPIEEAFSKLKSVMKANEEQLVDTDPNIAILSAIGSITAQDCTQWITHAGYV